MAYIGKPFVNKSTGAKGYVVTVSLGVDPKTGKYRTVSKRVLGGKGAAQAWVRKILSQHDSGQLSLSNKKRKIGSLLDALVLDYQINGKNLKYVNNIVGKHLRPYFGELGVDKLSTDELKKFIAFQQSKKLSKATVNHCLALLRRFYNLGRQATPPMVNAAFVPHFPMLKLNNTRKGYFEREQFVAMRNALPPEIRGVLTFAYCTGARRGEILSLTWPQVDLERRMVRLEPGETKNQCGRDIPVPPELLEMLKLEKETRDQLWPDCPWVFHRLGKRIRTFQYPWDHACRAAGLVDAAGKPTHIFHDLRRSGVRNLVHAGVPEHTAMKISGHKTRAIFDRYHIINERELQEAARKLSDYHDLKDKELSKSEFSTKSSQAEKTDVVQ